MPPSQLPVRAKLPEPVEQLVFELRQPGRVRPDAALFRTLLEHCEWNADYVAELTGKHRKQVFRWAEYCGIRWPVDRG